MNEAVFGLLVAYLALAVLLLNLLIYSRWSVWVKCGTIVLVTSFYFLSYHSLQGVLGWPTTATLPQRFLLLASSVQEPDKTSGDAGLIHVWVTELTPDGPASQPRAYELPYDKRLHYRLLEARKRMQQGVPQIGSIENEVEPDGRPVDPRRLGERQASIVLSDLPDPVLPEK